MLTIIGLSVRHEITLPADAQNKDFPSRAR